MRNATDNIQGSTMIKKQFALLPRMVAGKRIWFRSYEELFVWHVQIYQANVGGKWMAFEIGSWVKISEQAFG